MGKIDMHVAYKNIHMVTDSINAYSTVCPTISFHSLLSNIRGKLYENCEIDESSGFEFVDTSNSAYALAIMQLMEEEVG